MIQYCGRQSIVLGEEQSVSKHVRAGNFSAGVFEGLRDIHDNKGLILNDEDRAPSQAGVAHGGVPWRGKAQTARGRGGFPHWAGRFPEPVDQSSSAQQA